MENGANGMKLMGAYAIGLVSLAAICLTGIAVITGFKNTGLVDNTTASYFIAGIAIFGTFAAVLALGMVGKIIINLFKSGQ
jgi:hypothetical protein